VASTLKDVAQRAGVSGATVSRVLNGKGNATPAVRNRVLRAAAALRYQPNRTARRLRIRRSEVIGLILSDIENPFFTALIHGVEDVAHRNGYSLILCNSGEDPKREQLYSEVMRAEGVAGVVIATTSDRQGEAGARELLAHGIAVVAVDRRIPNLDLDTVVVDNAGGAEAAVTHLFALGHRRVGYIGGPLSVTTGRERQEGYERAHRLAGRRVARDLVRHGDFKFASGFARTLELLGLPKRPSAVLVANNLMTLGALTAIHDRGLLIPKDIAVVGFDDLPWAPALNPPLTTVAQPIYAEGEAAAELLLQRIAEPKNRVAQTRRLETKLVIRRSCGAHPARPQDRGGSQK